MRDSGADGVPRPITTASATSNVTAAATAGQSQPKRHRGEGSSSATACRMRTASSGDGSAVRQAGHLRIGHGQRLPQHVQLLPALLARAEVRLEAGRGRQARRHVR